MRIKNVSSSDVVFQDLKIPAFGFGQARLVPNAEAVVFDSDANRSFQLGTLLNSGVIIRLSEEEPTSGLPNSVQPAVILGEGASQLTVSGEGNEGQNLSMGGSGEAEWKGGFRSVKNIVLTSDASSFPAVDDLDLTNKGPYLIIISYAMVWDSGSFADPGGNIGLNLNDDLVDANYTVDDGFGNGTDTPVISVSGQNGLIEILLSKGVGNTLAIARNVNHTSGDTTPWQLINYRWSNNANVTKFQITIRTPNNDAQFSAGSRLTTIQIVG